MTRAEYYQRRHEARRAIRARDTMPCDPYTTWQDRDRAQRRVQECVGRLPGYAYARPYGFIDRQTRLVICAEFPQWIVRRNRLWHKRQREAMQRLIREAVDCMEESLAWLDTLSPASAAAPLSGVAPPGPSGAGDPLVETHA